MKKLLFAALMLAGMSFTANAQSRWYSKEAKVNFYCEPSAEKIEAFTNSGFLVIDATTGQVEMSVLMKSFTFEKALMQEHFNENYVESDKFPKAVFKGTILEPASVKWDADGSYPVKIKGQMTMHGVTNEMTAAATITIKGGKPLGNTTFMVTLADYKITVPKVVEEKVSKTVRIVVDASLNPLATK